MTVRSFFVRVRRWLIRKLAGRMGVCLNVTVLENAENPGRRVGTAIQYAGRYGGICENVTHKRLT